MLIVMGLLLVSGINAMAGEILWTINDVTFTFADSNVNTLTGTFITDSGITTILELNLAVTGPETADDFTATQSQSAELPSEISVGNTGFLEYVDLFLSSPLTSAGGTVSISSGFNCPGCGSLVVNDDTGVTGVIITPEPSAIPLVGGGVMLLGIASRRKWLRVS
jgi:hypothetical protein